MNNGSSSSFDNMFIDLSKTMTNVMIAETSKNIPIRILNSFDML